MTADEIEAFCRVRMAAYKVPRRIDLVDAIPKSPTGKILKRVLREG
jgi:long-chain acyl-CoA synthetase